LLPLRLIPAQDAGEVYKPGEYRHHGSSTCEGQPMTVAISLILAALAAAQPSAPRCSTGEEAAAELRAAHETQRRAHLEGQCGSDGARYGRPDGAGEQRRGFGEPQGEDDRLLQKAISAG
jgi:hypothetical protein